MPGIRTRGRPPRWDTKLFFSVPLSAYCSGIPGLAFRVVRGQKIGVGCSVFGYGMTRLSSAAPAAFGADDGPCSTNAGGVSYKR